MATRQAESQQTATNIAATAEEGKRIQDAIESTKRAGLTIQTEIAATAQKVESIEATASYYKNLQVGDSLLFGNYEQDNIVENGAEPIEWYVVDVSEGRAVLISRFGLAAESFNRGGGKINWEKCTLRKWLNEDFYEAAFNEVEKKKIEFSYLDNPDNHVYGTDGGEYTSDKVYILSYYEAGRYLVTPDSRKLLPTDYAISHRAEVDADTGFAIWWLRTPGNFPGGSTFVDADGSLNLQGYNAMVDQLIIRPTIKIIL